MSKDQPFIPPQGRALTSVCAVARWLDCCPCRQNCRKKIMTSRVKNNFDGGCETTGLRAGTSAVENAGLICPTAFI